MSEAAELYALVRGLRARLAEGDVRISPPGAASPPPPAVAAPPPPAVATPNPEDRRPADASAPERLAALKAEVASCRKCPLGAQRLTAVFGVGSPAAQVMFVGEGPGYDEDRRGEPFVGKAGQLLDKILAAIGLSRGTVYIANIVKCHPMADPSTPDARGNDRPPTAAEMAACRPYLEEQIRLIRPKVLVTLGNSATKALLGVETGISRLRGRWQELSVPGLGPVKVLPTYHPAALLRDPNLKRDVWTDMKNLKQELERP